MKIFISYRRADTTFVVGRIKDRLTAAFGDQSVFRDLDDIPSGVDFRTVLEEQTNGCNILLVIIGPKWVEVTDGGGNRRLFDPGDYTRIEVETGLRRLSENKAAVFPVLVMNAQPPSATDLPESLAPLTYQNAISIRNDPDFNGDMEKLIRDIRRALGYAVDDLKIDESYEPKTVYVAEGPFLMGSPQGEGTPELSMSQYEVTIPAYRIGIAPITNGQYEVFVRETGTRVLPIMGWFGQRVPEDRADYPVAGITFKEARAYCEWLSQESGHSYTIPNEAQWEKACRAGTTSRYPWGDEFDPGRSNLGKPGLAAVNAYPIQNEFGMLDLLGNIRQWTLTLWGESRVRPDPIFGGQWKNDRRNDINASRQVLRVIRGCSFAEDPSKMDCSTRNGQLPTDAGWIGAGIGFRVVMNL